VVILEAEVRRLDAPWLSRENLAVTRWLAGVIYAIRSAVWLATEAHE
jgi:hypothetical protein